VRVDVRSVGDGDDRGLRVRRQSRRRRQRCRASSAPLDLSAPRPAATAALNDFGRVVAGDDHGDAARRDAAGW
jgi:hypothetical protein